MTYSLANYWEFVKLEGTQVSGNRGEDREEGEEEESGGEVETRSSGISDFLSCYDSLKYSFCGL